MRLDNENGEIILTLSERNVLALLDKVRDPDSKRELLGVDAPYRVRVEPDEVHYRGRTPGQMSSRTEEFIRLSKNYA